MENSTFCEKTACYLMEMRDREIQPEVLVRARNFLADTIACILAGSNEKPALLVREYAEEMGGKPISVILGSGGKKTDPYHAAMINGTAAHFHDYDDVCTTMIGHPSVAVLPAVLAVGGEMDASGERILRAYITGVETCALMGRAFVPEHCRRGWHSTQSLGVFGAAAAAAELLDLNELQLRNALGIAASESCGLKGNTGTMTKPLHAGRAAAKGIMAAKLGKLGFTSNRTIMEMEAGFIRVTTEAFHEERVTEAMEIQNSEFLNAGLIMKPWPACKATHNAVWAMLQLMKKYKLNPDEIEHIDCKVLPYAKDILRYSIAKTPTEGKFSMNYCIAKIALQGKLTMADFEGDEIRDEQLIGMMNRIRMVVDETLIPGAYFHDLESSQVEVRMKDGRLLKERCDFAKGGPNNPMTKEEMREKWKDCMCRAITPEGAETIVDMLLQIEQLEKISTLFDKIESFVSGRNRDGAGKGGDSHGNDYE